MTENGSSYTLWDKSPGKTPIVSIIFQYSFVHILDCRSTIVSMFKKKKNLTLELQTEQKK